MGMFVGLMPWRTDGVTNDAPKDIYKMIDQFAAAGGNLIQFQLLYEDGALFTSGNGLTLNSTKINYCKKIRDYCASKGVCVAFVLFDHCTLKRSNKWAKNPLNKANGGPFGQPFDIYNNYGAVNTYVTDVVRELNGANVAFEIINEGENTSFAAKVRDALKSLGVTRIFTSGNNPGGLWRYSEHSQIKASCVKLGQLPNTDGATWNIVDVKPIANAVRSLVGGGLVFDGVTDAIHNWKEFLANIQGITPPTPPTPPSPGYTPVDGDLRDKGNEVWNPNFNGMDVRLSANDSENLSRSGIACKGTWYPLAGSVGGKGVTLSTAPDGGIVVKAVDVVSGITGLKYHCVGYLVNTSANMVETANPLTIPKSRCYKTLRVMYISVTGSPTPPTPPTPPVGVLCDPNPAKYTKEYMKNNGDYEECGLESQKGICARYAVWKGNSGGYWFLSSIAIDRVKVVNKQLISEDFTVDGYIYHTIGFSTIDPQGKNVQITNPPFAGDRCTYGSYRYILVECRKA
jgi:hypothetical protein